MNDPLLEPMHISILLYRLRVFETDPTVVSYSRPLAYSLPPTATTTRYSLIIAGALGQFVARFEDRL